MMSSVVVKGVVQGFVRVGRRTVGKITKIGGQNYLREFSVSLAFSVPGETTPEFSVDFSSDN